MRVPLACVKEAPPRHAPIAQLDRASDYEGQAGRSPAATECQGLQHNPSTRHGVTAPGHWIATRRATCCDSGFLHSNCTALRSGKLGWWSALCSRLPSKRRNERGRMTLREALSELMEMARTRALHIAETRKLPPHHAARALIEDEARWTRSAPRKHCLQSPTDSPSRRRRRPGGPRHIRPRASASSPSLRGSPSSRPA